MTFFQSWAKKIGEKEYFCYDITSISSYSEQNEYVRAGISREGEQLKQINLGLVYGQTSHLPRTLSPFAGQYRGCFKPEVPLGKL